MKSVPGLALFMLAACGAHANDNGLGNAPVYRVVNLLRSLRDEITLDGKQEQQLFDRYSCWVEDSVKEVMAAIAEEIKDIASDQEQIEKLVAEIAAGKANLKNIADDIVDNKEAQQEATDKRQSDHKVFEATTKDNVASKNAIAEAIKVLAGTGTGSFLVKGKSLSAFQESQVLSVVGGVRKALKKIAASMTVSEDDLDVVQAFVDKPSDFFGKHSMSAAQVSETNNPFGDYSPQSTRIQGILKGMLQAFSETIAKDIKEEDEAVKAYNDLTTTRQKELETLQKTQSTTELSVASKTKLLQETRDDKKQTEFDLESDEAFVEETKKAAKAKSLEWNERVRLRSEELNGINEAIGILTGGKKTFTRAFTTFIQTSSVQVVKARSMHSLMQSAYMQVQILATRYHSLRLAKIAASMQAGGHFDKVIAMIDEMMELLRKEEASDIFHKDRCESSENANKNEMEDLNSDLKKNANAMARLETDINETRASINEMKDEKQAKEDEIMKQLKLRNQETDDFAKALKDDVEAIELIDQAIVALSKYYTNNKLKLGGLVQQGANPVYAIDGRDAPKADFAKADSKSEQSGGIVAILQMIKEDLEKEVKVAREEEADDQAAFESSKSSLQASIDALSSGIATAEGKKADAQGDLAAAENLDTRLNGDLTDQQSLKGSLYDDCKWVKTNFQSRYDKRKTEMQGLTDAKAYLSGIA